MGMVIFEESGTFNPSDWGLEAGNMLQVICVGGGAGGSASDIGNGGDLGNPGEASSFGSYITAQGANTDISAPNGMGRGGSSAFYEYGSSNRYYLLPGGGAGGYLPGLPQYGGSGGNGASYPFDASASFPVNAHAPSGLGGVGQSFIASDYGYEFFTDLPFANLSVGASGIKGAGGGSGDRGGAGGNGYGAGGGGGACGSDHNALYNMSQGGNSGELKIATIKLINTNSISVTVGDGGSGATYNSAKGGKGAPGVVIITW